jgi:hypothetical protein
MDDKPPDVAPTLPPSRHTLRRIRSSQLRPTKSPVVNGIILLVVVAAAVALIYSFLVGPAASVDTNVIDFSQSMEKIQELSTVKSHLRFGVVVREEGGNIIVRTLAEQAGGIGMNDLSSLLFEDPTMIVELHGVATYGVRLDDLASRVEQTDTAVVLSMRPAEVLDVNLVTSDTRIVAQMKGLFRSSNTTLLHEANLRGEAFVLNMARGDTALLELAGERTRVLLSLLIERSGRHAIFR